MSPRRLYALLRGMPGALFLAILVASVFPELGREGGLLRAEVLGPVGIFLIFLLQGVLLPTRTVLDDLREWRLHALVQGWIFLVSPMLALMVIGFSLLLPPADTAVRSGLFFLGILPTTISTGNVLVAQAKGNLPASLANTVIANVVAVVLVPLALALALSAATSATGAGGMGVLLAKIFALIVLPMIAGQALRPVLKGLLEPQRGRVRAFNNSVIVFLVFAAFADSVSEGIWSEYGLPVLVTLLALVLLLLGLSKGLLWLYLKRSAFNRADRVTAFFCGSQKSLATGVSIANVAFVGSEQMQAGIVLLPLIIYHLAQLVLDSELASRWEKRAELERTSPIRAS